MQWPAVFLPACGRTGSRRSGKAALASSTSFPEVAIDDPDRYRGTLEDETRLFYVAVTRAQKYLFASFAPGAEPALREAVGVLRPLRRAAVGLDP